MSRWWKSQGTVLEARRVERLRPVRQDEEDDLCRFRYRAPCFSGLVRVDDTASDFACTAEQIEQRLALPTPDGPLQSRQILREALQHLQHGLAVVQEHVAPHRRVRGRDTGKIAEA